MRDIEKLNKLAEEAIKAGFQVCTHAIGDRGNREVLDMYARVFKAFPDKKTDSRFRIEHAQHINKEDLIRFKELGVIPAMQSIHLASDRHWAIDRLVKWSRNFQEQNVIHIHGKKDSVFPIKNIKDPVIKIDGDHAIVLTHSDWFSKNLPKIINQNLVDSIYLE